MKCSPQVSSVWKDPSLPLQDQVCLEASVLWVITVLRAAACPPPVQPALTKTKLEAKANTTVNHVLLVRKTKNNVARMMSSWGCHQCWNVFTRLVPGVCRAGTVQGLSSRVPLPGAKFQPSALPSWLCLSWKPSSSALSQRHL